MCCGRLDEFTFLFTFFMKKSVITLLKYVTIFNENNAQIIILEFRAR
jgi:hypothetical protein